MIKKFIYNLILIISSISLSQEQYIIVNEDSISLSEFNKKYKTNIEVEGFNQAVDNYIRFSLMKQAALKSEIDTTDYFKNNLKKFYETEVLKYTISDSLQQRLTYEVYQNLSSRKKIEIFTIPYQNPFSKNDKKTTQDEISTVYKNVCEKVNAESLENYYQRRAKKVFTVKPMMLPYEIQKLSYSTEPNQCSQILFNENAASFIKVLSEEKIDSIDSYDILKDGIAAEMLKTPFLNYLQKNSIQTYQSKIDLEEDKKALKEVINLIGNKFFIDKKLINSKLDKPIWKTNYSTFSQKDLVGFLNASLQQPAFDENTDQGLFLDYYIPFLKNDFIQKTYKSYFHLYEPEFGDAYEILANALAVNYYIETEIYRKAALDTIAQKEYLKKKQQQYFWPKRYDLSIYRVYNQKNVSKVLNMVKRNQPKKKILKQFNPKNGNPEVVLTHGTFVENSEQLPKEFNPSLKIQTGKYLTQNAVIIINKVIPKGPITIEEAGFNFMESYRSDYLQKELDELMSDAKIIIPENIVE